MTAGQMLNSVQLDPPGAKLVENGIRYRTASVGDQVKVEDGA